MVQAKRNEGLVVGSSQWDWKRERPWERDCGSRIDEDVSAGWGRVGRVQGD